MIICWPGSWSRMQYERRSRRTVEYRPGPANNNIQNENMITVSNTKFIISIPSFFYVFRTTIVVVNLIFSVGGLLPKDHQEDKNNPPAPKKAAGTIVYFFTWCCCCWCCYCIVVLYTIGEKIGMPDTRRRTLAVDLLSDLRIITASDRVQRRCSLCWVQ